MALRHLFYLFLSGRLRQVSLYLFTLNNELSVYHKVNVNEIFIKQPDQGLLCLLMEI